jgi:aromatic ring-opening dioxygenase catalytic subunit (LigB family)
MREDFGSDPGYTQLESWLSTIGARHRDSVKAILAISAHWEEKQPTVHFGTRPGMLYDYYGFPPHTYHLKWPAPGAPDVAARLEELLQNAGFQTQRERERGYDHGTFVPLMLAFPEAWIPVAQVSLVSSLDPVLHVNLGRALEPLRDEGVLILASGMSYHNLRGLMSGGPTVASDSERFDAWLATTLAIADPAERRAALADWKRAPGALGSHPRSEHLVPVFVAAGAAGSDTGHRDFSEMLMGARVSGHVFGA